MESILEIYKIGYGPSSSHTMGPAIASKRFLQQHSHATRFCCVLYGSLALTGKGHLTDYIIRKTFAEEKKTIQVLFDYTTTFAYHPNAMKFVAYEQDEKIDEWIVFSVGGGSLKEENEARNTSVADIYPHQTMNEILNYCSYHRIDFVQYVQQFENETLVYELSKVLAQMKKTLQHGLFQEGYLPGSLHIQKRAKDFYHQYLKRPSKENLVYAYALASSEENASGHLVVTAPTCGSCAVLPAVLFSYQTEYNLDDQVLIEALMIAGLIGNIVKTNASISGAEVGCQGEIGVACSMAAAALTYLQGGKNNDIEYAAEVALEHHLGMTCDPVDGLVQIPCIERNAVAAMQAYNVAAYVKIAGAAHNITLDSVIQVMKETGTDLHAKYRETSTGGLAIHNRSNYGK
ncbi:MAG: L-serine ammonia-lyase, iron-sulfur-dependent, subunit alpha [Prevotella sp.]|nr:L-serine ammonia-lyase, iron-sulfur-dependent, subunit alpha [Staphylococcus sp.]MCM1350500.1 L-serine ammonia-lyase, iron-sulfur-dependent, subunit alpha [Prevotella sp.]